MLYIPLEQANKGIQVLLNLPSAAHQGMHGKEGQEEQIWGHNLFSESIFWSLLLVWAPQELFFLMEKNRVPK